MKKLIVSLILPAALLQLSSSAMAQVGSVEVIYDGDQVQSTLISGDVELRFASRLSTWASSSSG